MGTTSRAGAAAVAAIQPARTTCLSQLSIGGPGAWPPSPPSPHTHSHTHARAGPHAQDESIYETQEEEFEAELPGIAAKASGLADSGSDDDGAKAPAIAAAAPAPEEEEQQEVDPKKAARAEARAAKQRAQDADDEAEGVAPLHFRPRPLDIGPKRDAILNPSLWFCEWFLWGGGRWTGSHTRRAARTWACVPIQRRGWPHTLECVLFSLSPLFPTVPVSPCCCSIRASSSLAVPGASPSHPHALPLLPLLARPSPRP